MKTDSIFYRIFLDYPQSFFDLIGESSAQENNYKFSSVEVKQLSFRLDGLFLPTDENSNLPLYLVEVQFQADGNLYYRLFSEFFLFLRQYKPPHPWQMVVIYPSRKIEREQTIHFGGFLKLPNITRVYLDELGESTKNSLGIGMINLVVESEEKSVSKAKKLIEKAQNQLIDEGTKRQLIDLIESIIVYKFPQKSREEIEAMFELADLKKTKVYQEAFTEGEAKLVLLLLNTRFPELSSAYQEQIQGLSTEQLENLAKAFLNFGSEADLRQWLEQNG
ncbi:Rpn family recombination-promoting nuclease/putative transposase [Cyanothece sp. BG0011]|uniref:Rpn family recombination-promoting nuclease/putative transposase n=1 Tax=Cyanothece sp. BG0011 TaxID=2082950 RepID=UPI000D1ECFF6|nr:Rpn family recombination-promoting nuclease/putative transposase [Cyanothece sp. BG0011]